MQAIERYERLRDHQFDSIIMDIKTGKIKTGRYAGLVKIRKGKTMKGKVLFKDDRRKEEDSSEQG